MAISNSENVVSEIGVKHLLITMEAEYTFVVKIKIEFLIKQFQGNINRKVTNRLR